MSTDESKDGWRVASASATRQAMAIVAEQLRMVWNARGGVDIVALESAFHPDFGNGRPSTKTLDAALGALER